MSEKLNRDAVFLCYVDDDWAYFHEKPPTEVWGDDWNDAPYEHNAGTPYGYSAKVAFDGSFESPTAYGTSGWTVEQINKKAIAWLRSPSYLDPEDQVVILAGVSLTEFQTLIEKGGGKVYFSA